MLTKLHSTIKSLSGQKI